MIDLQRLQDIFGDDKASIKAFLQSFVELTQTLLDELKVAIQQKDTKRAKELFHRLKGSAGNSGIMKIYLSCVDAEGKVLAGEWGEVNDIFLSVIHAFKELQVELENF